MFSCDECTDSVSGSINTLRFAMQASHVKNKVEKHDAQQKAGADKAKKAESGNALCLVDGTAAIELPTGPLTVRGTWDTGVGAAAEKIVLVLGDCKVGPESLQGLLQAVAEAGCQVLAPELTGSSDKELDGEVDMLLALLDWLGVAQAVVYGRDWGAIKAIKFKIRQPKRVRTLVLENRRDKLNESEYKSMIKRTPNHEMSQLGGNTFNWIFDFTIPKSMDSVPLGANMRGFKGKSVLLFPFVCAGKHDPKVAKTWSGGKMAAWYSKVLKTTPIDNYLMDEADVASKIVACCRSASPGG
eukprot:TRINITY_DN21171_c0_g1_i2.p1 TRINITY_DN21171_c0_g1~~TRINITY_DN21171_c0_g1_i2.p1  ORF type:complete len:299 (+),score=57.65 TRINITY_DN21171_c0_g1_i2:125-1021(+)